MWLPEPRSSPAPHFDGQRWLSGGTFHCAKASTGAARRAIAVTVRFMCFPLVENFVQTFVVQRAGHPGELVAELALVRGHAVRVEGLARAPDLEHREVIRTVGLQHDRAKVAGRGTARAAVGLEERRGLVSRGRLGLHISDDVERADVGWNGGGCGGWRLGDGVHGEEAQQGRDERGRMESHVFFSLVSPAAAGYRTPWMTTGGSALRAPSADHREDGEIGRASWRGRVWGAGV